MPISKDWQCRSCGGANYLQYTSRKTCADCLKVRKAKYFKNGDLQSATLKKSYGIDLAEYNKLVDKQNNLCGICKKEENLISYKTDKPYNLAVDHCHKTGAIRGLLCNNCNRGLGLLKDSTVLLENALKYLRGEA